MSHFLLDFIGFFFLNTFVFFSSTLLTLHLSHYRIKDWSKALITLTLIFYSLVTVSMLLLGMCKVLFFVPMMTFHTLLLLLLLGVFGKSLYKEWHYIDESKDRTKIDWFHFAAIFTPFLIVSFTRFFNALFQVPVEYDNLAYHLPFMVKWLHTGNLWDVYYSAFAGPLGYYPSNYELLDLWTALPFHSDLMINLVNLPIFCLLPLVLYRVAKNFGITEEGSLLTVFLFLMMPVSMRQLGVPLVDMYFCLTFLWGLYYIQEFRKTRALGEVFLSGLALGLFTGTKYLGIVYVIPLIVIFLIFLLLSSKQRWKSLGIGGGLFLLGTFLTGSFWYIRNWLDTGNPLFPTNVSLGSWEIFTGYRGITKNLVDTSLGSNIPVGESFTYFWDRFVIMVGGQSYLFLVCFCLVLLVIVVKFVRSFILDAQDKRARERTRFIGYVLVVGAILTYLAGYWVSPYSFKDLIPNVRYAFMFLLLASIMVGIVVTELYYLRPFIYLACFAVGIYNLTYLILFPPVSILTNEKLILDFSALSEYFSYVLLFILLLAGLVVFFLFLRFALRDKKLLLVTILLGLNTGAMSYILFFNTAQIREQVRAKLYYGWYSQNQEWLSLLKAAEWFNSDHPTAAIAYSGFNFHYPLFGRHLERDVDYVNVNACTYCTYKDFRDQTQSIRTDADFSSWEANLKKMKKEYLVLKKSDATKIELDWIAAHPEMFEMANEINDVAIYKLK